MRKTKFIPFPADQLADYLASQHSDSAALQRCFRLIQLHLGIEFNQRLAQIKTLYRPLDPDRVTRSIDEPAANADAFQHALTELLTNANYQRIEQDAIHAALKNESLFNIKLAVNLDEFERCTLFYRGHTQCSESRASRFNWLGVKPKTIAFKQYNRVLLYVQAKANSQAENTLSIQQRSTLKLFQNVPEADLEMLFPNTQVAMKLKDKLLIGVPSVVGGAVMLTTKLGPTVLLLGSALAFYIGLSKTEVTLSQANLIALGAGLAAFGGYVWRQIGKFKNNKMRFMKALSENLYFKNLDNNAGAIHRLIDEAEEEEVKETLVAYHGLLRADGPISAEKLDKDIEAWFQAQLNADLDFDIEDALNKLLRLGLAIENKANESPDYTAVPLKTANQHLSLLNTQHVEGL